MAEHIYIADSFGLSSTITYGDFGSEVTNLRAAANTVTFPTSDLTLVKGESITRAILTADYYMSTGSSSGDEEISVNGSYFNGTHQLDVSEFTEGQNWGVNFYFCLANKALGDNALTVEYSSVTKTVTFYNIVLTITTSLKHVYYYDGTQWVSATIKYYNGSEWVSVNGLKYYDGSSWVE